MKKILITIVFLPLFSFGQILSQYIETNAGDQPKALELYNNTASTIYLGNTNLKVYYASNTSTTESLLTTVAQGQWKPGQVLIIGPLSTTSQNNNSSVETLGTIGAQFQALMEERNPDHLYKERNMYFCNFKRFLNRLQRLDSTKKKRGNRLSAY